MALVNGGFHGQNDLLLGGGDVIITTSNGPQGQMLVHSDVLRKHVPWFGPMLSNRWATPQDLGDGRKGWKLQMYFDNEFGMGLSKHEATQLERGFIMPSGCPKNVQQEWAACNTDQEVALVIQQYPGPRPHLTEPLTPARRQFLYNEPQSPTYSLYEWLDTSDPYSLKHGEQPGLQHCKEPTYWPLLHAYLHLLPQNDEYSGLNYHWVEHSSRFPTDGWTRAKDVSHKTVQQYWSELWSAFIHLLYGHRLIFRRRLRTRSIVRFLAILHLLADYHQAWEQVGHVIRSTMRELPNIGKLVAQDPEFMVCISYRLQCQVIYYDALKHIAGRALYSSMIFSESDFYYERPSAPDDVQMLPLPESIVNAVAETCWRMRNSLLNRHQTFVHHLAHAHSDHRDTLQAEYRVAATAFLAFVNGWQEIVPVTKASARPHASRLIPSCEPVDEDAYDAYRTDMKRFQLPNLYLTLWQLSCSGTDQQLSFDLSLESQARVFNLDLPDLISAAKGILNDRFSGELLHSLMAPPEEPMECATWQPELYLDLEHGSEEAKAVDHDALEAGLFDTRFLYDGEPEWVEKVEVTTKDSSQLASSCMWRVLCLSALQAVWRKA
ncbi:hypothetical protein PMZ80_007062 [Knufia obscura]|uniref:Uncharacterized protein n=2 Tax=Knufia TaxID=430999 RepID=A0AAN8ET52_9EURO|nr:hypothetical protein PMZ80_007062 [Knufia obscura]KAK5953071.1 hypothetical protein OHC33_005639 [Knufia fluminis]